MLTFTSLGGTTVRMENGKGTLVVFGDDSHIADDVIVLKGVPDMDRKDGIVSWPGEYDLGGKAILGIGHQEGEHVSFAVEIDNVRCAFLFSPVHDWVDHELELLGDIDILFIPTDDPKLMQKLVDEIDPRVLVPLNTGGKEKHDEALKIIGAQNAEEVDEYKQKGSLPAEGREVVLLKEKAGK